MMKKFNYITFIALFVLLSGACSSMQSLSKKKKTGSKSTTTATTTAPSKPASTSSKGPKAYKDVITGKARSQQGLFDVHKVDDKYFFEIPDSLLGRDLLIVNRIGKSAANSRKSFFGYAGDHIGENVVRFEKGASDKVFLKSISYNERSQDTLGMYLSVLNSNLQPIVGSFEISAYNTDTLSKTKKTIIDVTRFVESDNSILNFNAQLKKNISLGSMFSDRSYIDTIRTYPTNIEIRTVKTYAQSPSSSAIVSDAPFTYELNSSILLLPKEPMKSRYFDPRVGYFARGYVDFDANPQGVERKLMVTRWRLEPKDEDIEKYKQGELVEPKKPIVFYIDPATPQKWLPYLIQGVNDWQIAFEKAGFKNAIYALEAPSDSTWSIDDARHSAIVYKPSTIPNASGPHVHDPRSGEIMESHINWYHNVMQLLHDWYFVQASAIDERARKMKFDDELMGQLIRFVSSHEVGHTLGLRHNFGSSATVPVEKLRDKAWVEANGHTPSIMDYARFNYIAQPEDNIGESGIFPRIGIYDMWAIEWGYRWLPDYEKAEDEVPYLNKLVIDKLAEDARYAFGTERDADDPRNQNEDLGDNAMLAGEYGIKNLKRIVPNLLEWTKESNKDYSNASNMYSQIAVQYGRYMGHAAKNIGGIYSTPKYVEESGNIYEYVPLAIQKEALAFLNKQLFTTPTWLIDQDLMYKAGVNPVNTIGNVQRQVMNRLISQSTFDKMSQSEAYNTSGAYTVVAFLNDLKKNIWSELNSGKQIDIYRRNLQKQYIESFDAIINPPKTSVLILYPNRPSDAASIARGHLLSLQLDIKRAIALSSGMSRFHLQDMTAKIDAIFDANKK